MARGRQVTRADVMPAPDYARQRKERRAAVIEQKRRRRMAVGPLATFHFENYDSMWLQIHEMLHIEKGGEEQIAGELDAYNPLIPRGRELVATVMFEEDDPIRRKELLGRLGGVERTAFMTVAGETIMGVPEADQERTSEEGKASSVQFIRFPFGREQVAKFGIPGAEVVVGFKHPEYSHMAVMAEAMREALAEDFD